MKIMRILTLLNAILQSLYSCFSSSLQSSTNEMIKVASDFTSDPHQVSSPDDQCSDLLISSALIPNRPKTK